MKPLRPLTVLRNLEITVLHKHLRLSESRTAAFAMRYLRINYFLDTDRIYQILTATDIRRCEIPKETASEAFKKYFPNGYKSVPAEPAAQIAG